MDIEKRISGNRGLGFFRFLRADTFDAELVQIPGLQPETLYELLRSYKDCANKSTLLYRLGLTIAAGAACVSILGPPDNSIQIAELISFYSGDIITQRSNLLCARYRQGAKKVTEESHHQGLLINGKSLATIT